MAGRLPRVTGATGAVTDTDIGYFVGVVINPYNPSGVGVIVTGVDQCRCVQFVLPFRAVVNQITTEVTTGGGASKKYGVGIYDRDSNLLVETGALDANTTQVNNTSVTATTLEPGVYFLAWTADTTTVQLRSLIFNTAIVANINSPATAKKIGTAANNGTNGVLPATLGTITAAIINSPYAVFSP